jgi:hypothetical protein
MTAQERVMLVQQVVMTPGPQAAMLVLVRPLTAREAMALLLATAMVNPVEMEALLGVTIKVR